MARAYLTCFTGSLGLSMCAATAREDREHDVPAGMLVQFSATRYYYLDFSLTHMQNAHTLRSTLPLPMYCRQYSQG